MPAMITLAKYLAQASAVAIKRYRNTGMLPSFVIRPKTKPKMPRNKKIVMPDGAKKKPKMKKTGKLKSFSEKLRVLNRTKPKNAPRKY